MGEPKHRQAVMDSSIVRSVKLELHVQILIPVWCSVIQCKMLQMLEIEEKVTHHTNVDRVKTP